MDREAWHAKLHRVTKSPIWLIMQQILNNILKIFLHCAFNIWKLCIDVPYGITEIGNCHYFLSLFLKNQPGWKFIILLIYSKYQLAS